MTTSAAQQIQPGDRPAGNIRGTRSPAVGRHGMIATSQTLASAAGLRVLQDGGNAIDAAVTAAAVLAVVEPSMNGIGGDLLAIVYDAKTRKVYGLDSTGRSAYAATPEEFARRGLQEMPGKGVLTVDVPGVVEGWHQLLTRFGTISLAKAMAPAIGVRARRLPRGRTDGRRVARQHEAVVQRSGDGGHVPSRRQADAARRHLLEPAPGADARRDREGRPRRVLQGLDRSRHRRRHQVTRRPARPARLRRSPGGLGGPDQRQLPRLRRARDAAEHAGVRGARDVEHHGRVRHQAAWPQHRRLPARGDRSQAHCLRRSQCVPRRSRSHAEGRPETAALEGLRGRAAQRDRYGQGRRRAMVRPATSRARISATRST